jgi:putative ABC transport system substrate-binding protein
MRLIGFAVVLTASRVLAPPAVEAQQPGKTMRIGILNAGAVSDSLPLPQALRALGWVEGQNCVIEYLHDDGKRDRLPALAAELVGRNVDVLFTRGTPAAQAAKGATASVPTVMVFVADPVRSGLVSSLARPGGNVTGMALFGPDIIKKQFELLKELAPRAATVGVLFDPTNSAQIDQLQHEVPAAAAALGLKTHQIGVDPSKPLEAAFAEAQSKRAKALVVYPLGRGLGVAREVADLAIRYRQPTVTTFRYYTEHGLLMSFSSNVDEQYQRAAAYIDKILKGAKPADLPVEQPTKFELVINLKTAKALGLTIPQTLLQRADQIIE